MKSAVVLSLATLALGSVIEQRNCPANNCNRQVTGTRAGLPPFATRSADCSSFQLVTVTPTPRTVTVTTFLPPAPTDPGCSAPAKRAVGVAAPLAARQVTVVPSAIPTYAAACDDRDEYASACSCLGVTATTTTIRPPRVTSTVTATATDCPQRAINAVPTCAHQCFADLVPSYGCTGIDDLACMCANFEAIGVDVTPCAVDACTHADVELIYGAASMGCDCYTAALPSPTA